MVGGAREAAEGLIDLGACDGVAAEAHAVVLEPGISVAVALALGHALLDGHVLLVQVAAEGQGAGAAVLVAAGVDEGLEGGQARREVDVPCVNMVNESRRRQGGSERPVSSHDDVRFGG